MRRAPKVAIGVAVVLIFFVVCLLILPAFANLEIVRARVVEALSRSAGASVGVGEIRVSLLPRPSVAVINVTISGPASGAIGSFTVYPRMLPLFSGKVVPARIQIKTADVRMDLPPEFGAASFQQLSLKSIEESTGRAISRLSARVPGLVVVEEGRLALFRGNQPLFFFTHIGGRLELGEKSVRVSVSCASNIWSHASLRGSLAPAGFRGEARLELAGFEADSVARIFFPRLQPRLENVKGDATVNLRADGVRVLSGEAEGRADHATFRKGSETLKIGQVRVKGAFRREDEKTVIDVSDLDSLSPAFKMSGRLALGPSSHAAGEVKALEADVAGVRSAILFFAPDDPDVRKVFGIVRAGRVFGATLKAEGGSLREMVKKENIVAFGNVENAGIIAPKIGLPVEGIKGRARIARGFLEGTGLSGRMGASLATKGEVRVGLGHDPPLHIDITLSADVSHLPFSLTRLADDNPVFVREMGMVRSASGRAVGRVVYDCLEGSGAPERIFVDASSFKLHATYDRYPHPFDIEGGTFHYEKAGRQKITVQNLSGRTGETSFSNLSAQFTPDPEPYLAIRSMAAAASLGEISQWLSSMPQVRDHFEKIGPALGEVKVETLIMNGPVLEPRQWQFRMTGAVENVTVQPVGLPGPVEARAGRFDASQERLSFTKLQARCLDASLTASGDADRYLEGTNRVDATFEGEMGAESAESVFSFIHLPAYLRILTPVSISTGRLRWEKGGETSFFGDLKVQKGPHVSVGVLSRSGELAINPLVIRDAASQASLLFTVRERGIDCAFRGNLAAKTLDALLARGRLLTGFIKGDIEAHIIPDKPLAPIARGNLEGEGLEFSGIAQTAVKIAAFHVAAKGKSVSVRSDFTALGQSASASGEVIANGDVFLLDGDLSTGGLDLERIAAQARGGDVGETLRRLPLRGTVRVTPEYVSYGARLWRPVRVDVSVDRGRVHALVKQAEICGIDTPGRIEYDGARWDFDFVLASEIQEVTSSLVCLFNDKDFTGVYALNGEIRAKGKTGEELVRSLRGEVNFSAMKGRVYRFTTLAKIFEIAGLSVIYAIPDLMKNGFAYDFAEAKLQIEGEKVTIKEGVLDAPSANLIWQGAIDPVGKKIDALVLVVPFTTLGRIIKLIPVFRYVMAGRLLAIPVRLSGDLERPDVTPLPPSAVGEQLLGMGERILKLPLKIIESLIPRSSSSGNK